MTTLLEPDPDSDSRFAAVLGEALAHAASEPILLARLEEFFSPQPARLAESSEEETQLNSQIHRVVAAFGGAPRLIIQEIDASKPMYDTYMSAALSEAMAVFHRARRSVCRAQAFMIGAHMLGSATNLFEEPVSGEHRAAMRRNADAVFWEHAETSFIRLASYWDRLGQILDFAFFSIRQYERDGFSAVIDRIRANVLRMNPDYEVDTSWRELWSYKKSEREDGLQWLLSRRNLLVHSMHLREQLPSHDDELFESAFNHLDARLRRDLAPGTQAKEVERLHMHLSHAARLFAHVLKLCEHHANRDRAFG
ncbi:MAG: hypothetical protein ACKVIH_10155 [Burkholderiales bacterium]